MSVLLIGGGLTLVALGFLLVYFVIFPTSSPKPFKLRASARAAVADPTAAAPVSTSGPSPSWKVASGSQAGYRVREKLAFLPAQSDAVGRTTSVSGSAKVLQSASSVTIAAASFTVAVGTLRSDRSMRDEKIHEIGLESDRYPTATFVLLEPISLASSSLDERVARATATGVFDIHGVSKRETLPVELSLSGSTLQAAGSLTFPWGEFGMSAPSIGGFVDVTEHATMEFDLRLQRAS